MGQTGRLRMRQGMRLYVVMGLILLLQLTVILYFCGKKTGFHYDEYYSYYSSNVTRGLVPTDREWKSGGEIRDEFTVLEGERFRFADVVRMQTYDVHPPFYYLLLHAVCSLMPGVFSKWSGLILNLVVFEASWFVLARLTFEMMRGMRDEKTGRIAAAAVCLLYGFNPAVLSGVMLVRMYMLLALLVLLITWLHVRAVMRGRRGWKFYVPVALTIYLGFLTHYYFAVYLFFLAAATELHLFAGKTEQKKWKPKWKDCFAYGGVVVGAMAAAAVSYPACLGHIFRGYRGKEAMGEFFNPGNTLGRLRFFAGLLNEYVFSSALPFVLLMLLLLAVTVKMLQRRSKTKAQRGRYAALWIVAAAVAGYFGVVTKTALLTAEEANRYQLPVYGLILMLLFVAAVLLSGRIAALCGGIKREMLFTWAVAGIMFALPFAGEISGLFRGRVLFLYEEDGENIAFARENHATGTVYFYHGNLAWMVWDDSLELMQYDRIYFVNMADLSPLADEAFEGADRLLVYAARGDDQEEALAAAEAAFSQGAKTRKVRELLYCDLYEIRR